LLTAKPAFASDPKPERLQMVQELCELVGSGRDPSEVGGVIDALRNRDGRWQRAALTGLAEGMSRRGTSFPQFLGKLPDRAAAKLATDALAAAAAPAADPKADEASRLAAVRLLAHAPWD